MNVEIVSRKALSGFKQEKHVFHFLGARISIRVSSIGNPKNSGGIVALVGSQWGATFEWWWKLTIVNHSNWGIIMFFCDTIVKWLVGYPVVIQRNGASWSLTASYDWTWGEKHLPPWHVEGNMKWYTVRFSGYIFPLRSSNVTMAAREHVGEPQRSPDRELTMTVTALKSSKCNLEESRDSYKVLHNHGLVYLFWEYLDIFRVCVYIYIHMHIPIFVHILHIFVDVPLATGMDTEMIG